MPDIADDHATYREAMRRAEEAAGITRDDQGNEVIAEQQTPAVTPELEGAVPVPASDQPLTPEPEQTPEGASPDTPVEVVTPEPVAVDPAIKIAELEARLAEKESFIGRQSSEIGELRSAVEEVRARQSQPAPQAPASVIPITQELIDTNPAIAVQAAFDQRNEQALHLAFEAWREVDPFSASTWRNDRLLEQQQQQFEAKLAETQKAIETATAPLQESADERAWAVAFDEVRGTHPDFMEHAARLLEEVAPQHDYLLAGLQSNDPKTKAKALSALYAVDRFGHPEAVQAQLEQAAQEAAAEAAAARAAAGVVSGQPNAGQPAVEQTDEELEQQAYISRQRGKPSLAKGWTGR